MTNLAFFYELYNKIKISKQILLDDAFTQPTFTHQVNAH